MQSMFKIDSKSDKNINYNIRALRSKYTNNWRKYVGKCKKVSAQASNLCKHMVTTVEENH